MPTHHSLSSLFHLAILSMLIFTILSTPQSPIPSLSIAYGSCYLPDRIDPNRDIFNSILSTHSDVFLWLGDFAYLDIFGYDSIKGKKTYSFDTVDNCRGKYSASYHHPSYRALRESGIRILGIWDDHDAGINDAGKDNIWKDTYRQMFLDYMDEDINSPRRTQSGGMYTAVHLDKDKKIKLILLDGRYSRDELTNHTIPEEEKTTLGEEQEKWLEEELKKDDNEITLIAAGYQILPHDKLLVETFYPKSRYHLLKSLVPGKRVVLLSGDIHMAEIVQTKCTIPTIGYPLLEFTSSGLTHAVSTSYSFLHRLLFSFVYKFFVPSVQWAYPGKNFAKIDIYLPTPSTQFLMNITFYSDDATPLHTYTLSDTYFNHTLPSPHPLDPYCLINPVYIPLFNSILYRFHRSTLCALIGYILIIGGIVSVMGWVLYKGIRITIGNRRREKIKRE